jgi:hypothetical protein
LAPIQNFFDLFVLNLSDPTDVAESVWAKDFAVQMNSAKTIVNKYLMFVGLIGYKWKDRGYQFEKIRFLKK